MLINLDQSNYKIHFLEISPEPINVSSSKKWSKTPKQFFWHPWHPFYSNMSWWRQVLRHCGKLSDECIFVEINLEWKHVIPRMSDWNYSFLSYCVNQLAGFFLLAIYAERINGFVFIFSVQIATLDNIF